MDILEVDLDDEVNMPELVITGGGCVRPDNELTVDLGGQVDVLAHRKPGKGEFGWFKLSLLKLYRHMCLKEDFPQQPNSSLPKSVLRSWQGKAEPPRVMAQLLLIDQFQGKFGVWVCECNRGLLLAPEVDFGDDDCRCSEADTGQEWKIL